MAEEEPVDIQQINEQIEEVKKPLSSENDNEADLDNVDKRRKKFL